MVSKAIKKTPPKPAIKDRRSRSRRNKSPIKAVAAVSSIIHTCHRRLIKIFSKFARIGTPQNKKKKNKYAYQILPKTSTPTSARRSLFPAAGNRPLPTQTSPVKPTIFLDLDETLVHSKPDPPPEKYDFIVRPVIDGVKVDFYVLKRPYVDEFLEILSKKFEIVVFTAGIEEYASLVLSRLDRKSAISHRLYRDSCREIEGKFVKDLGDLGRELKRVVIVDDNPNSYVLQPENAIPIVPFTDDVCDVELRRLVEFFDGYCDGLEDLRDAVKMYLSDRNEQGKL